MAACSGAQAKPDAAPAAAAPAASAVCPVSGETFTPDASSPRSEYNGKTYVFCCGGCKKKFDADPGKFAAAPAPAKAADAGAAKAPCGHDCGKDCPDCAGKDGSKDAAKPAGM